MAPTGVFWTRLDRAPDLVERHASRSSRLIDAGEGDQHSPLRIDGDSSRSAVPGQGEHDRPRFARDLLGGQIQECLGQRQPECGHALLVEPDEERRSAHEAVGVGRR